MTNFVHTHFPSTHAGANRIAYAANTMQAGVKRLGSPHALATLLLAAVVAALLVVANQVIETMTDGHLLVGWIALWLVAFAAMGLLAQPARRAALGLREGFFDWRAASKEAHEDRKIWDCAQGDARVMAEIRAAMTRHNG